jgi:AAA family ATP:ADP antiporter
MTEQPRTSGVERLLNLFTVVRPGEARTALLLALNVFLILMAYYILKTVREGLILGEGSAELKSYLSAGQVVLLAFVVPYYGRLVAKFPRMKLINVVTIFFILCPPTFYLLAQFGVPLGIIYFVWIGIFSLMIVAQFWSFANDVYSKEEGERLLVIVGLGASLGAVAGAAVADRLIQPFGVLQLMLVGAGVLALELLLTNYIDRVERARRAPAAPVTKAKAAPTQNAFAMVFKTRYLLLMALMILLINWINATGEYILGSIVKERASAMVAGGTAGGLSEAQIIGGFYAKYFSLANALGLFLQLFVVSRLIKHRGVAVAVMVLPAISFGVYNILAFVPFLRAALVAKVIENSTDYSLNNTVRNMLFLPCTYEQKFAAKQAIDSFFVRMGDVLSAALVLVGTTLLALPSYGFAAVNAALAVVALILAWRVGRYYKKLTAPTVPAAAA